LSFTASNDGVIIIIIIVIIIFIIIAIIIIISSGQGLPELNQHTGNLYVQLPSVLNGWF